MLCVWGRGVEGDVPYVGYGWSDAPTKVQGGVRGIQGVGVEYVPYMGLGPGDAVYMGQGWVNALCMGWRWGGDPYKG